MEVTSSADLTGPKRDPAKPVGEFLNLLALVRAGKLFAIQDWLKSGHKPQPPDAAQRRYCPLMVSVQCGFHNLTEVLVKARPWPQHRLDDALCEAMTRTRLDMVELLLQHGAAASSVNFVDVCRTAEPDLIELLLRAGADPVENNAFAVALTELKAKPLLKFFRALKDEFPELQPQASLALAETVRQKKVGWAALLPWAGADPFMKVPDRFRDSWVFNEGFGRTAAEEACWTDNAEMLKVLHLKPTLEQAHHLLEFAALSPCVEVLQELLTLTPQAQLNGGDPPSCRAVERLVARHPYRSFDGKVPDREAEPAIACLELLLKAGAWWHPPESEIAAARRALLDHPPHYIVRILRLLMSTDGAADRATLAELCRTPQLRNEVGEADQALAKEIQAMRSGADPGACGARDTREDFCKGPR